MLDAEAMPPSFHPTLDVKGKEYLYKINFSNFQLPQERFYAWHVPYLLDIENMQLGTTLLQGSHDYSSFCNQRNSMRYEHTIRQIDTIHISCVGETSLEILIRGNHFLYKMARNLVGTLVYVGRRKLHLDDLPTILSSKNRCYAGMTAPAHGLTLKKVIY